jgi:hypothetical protein
VVLRLNVVRPWISRSGPRAQRETTFVFRLQGAAIVEFVVTRLAPDCRVVGKFRVAGRAGLNRVQFRGRIGRRVLRAGTYRVTARTLRGATPVRVDLVIVGQPNPLPGELAAARAANACAAVDRKGWSSAEAGGLGPPATTPNGTDSESAFSRVGDVLGVQFTKAVDTVQEVPPFLFFVLGLAIALLGLAALPGRAAPNLRLQKLLAYHRELVALAGTVALIGAAITYVVW